MSAWMELYFCADSNTVSPTDDKNLSCRLSADKSFLHLLARNIVIYVDWKTTRLTIEENINRRISADESYNNGGRECKPARS